MKKRLSFILIHLMIASVATLTLFGSLSANILACVWSAEDSFFATLCKVGIGTLAPGERLHVADGHILLEGGGETALKIKRDITFIRAITVTGVLTDSSPNPIFEIGRIIQAGDGDPELRILYDDDKVAERAVMELDRKGIIASVKQDRGSHFEGFLSSTDPEPVFRLNSYPQMRLEMGEGGNVPVDTAIQRSAKETLSLITGNVEQVRVDAMGLKVSNGYLQLAKIKGHPEPLDCSDPDEVGRMTINPEGSILYVCTISGWGNMFVLTNTVSLPIISKQ